jgi:energy-coupling factor transport system permease protein
VRTWSSDYGCQYRAVDSPVHRLGAAAKLCIGALLCAAAVVARAPWALAALAAANAAYYLGARLTLSDLWRDTRYLFAQMAIILGLYALRDGLAGGLWPGLRIALQIFLFFVPGIVFLRTTRASEMMRGLARVLPYRISFLVFTSVRFVPLFAREMGEIATAQRLRGARLAPRDLLDPRSWRDAFHCLMIPLLVRALRTADEAALSAEAREFGVRPERTYCEVRLSGGPARPRPGAARSRSGTGRTTRPTPPPPPSRR